MNDYKPEQLTTIFRHMNNITARRILAIEDGSLIFRLCCNSSRIGEMLVSMPLGYKVGEYVDMVVVCNGKSSYSAMLMDGHLRSLFLLMGLILDFKQDMDS